MMDPLFDNSAARLRKLGRPILFLLSALLFGDVHRLQAATALTQVITYQGRLLDDGVPADGLYDIAFYLYDNESGTGSYSVPATNPIETIEVKDGLFSQKLTFAGTEPFIDGNKRWLKLAVRPHVVGTEEDLVDLSPLQELTPAPYSRYSSLAASATHATGADSATNADHADEADEADHADTATDATYAGVAKKLRAADGSPEAVFVDNDGKVGVGTSSPSNYFHVTAASDHVLIGVSGDNAKAKGFKLYTAGSLRWEIISTTVTESTDGDGKPTGSDFA
ncbi:MAG: hypothetical protein ABI579_05940, partial [Candidatus Sumerlaeota bacterium]